MVCSMSTLPCTFKNPERVAQAIAEVHVELVLIHPFRDGNGRAARLLADLMALQAALPPLDWTSISKGKGRRNYFSAVEAGMDRDYEPMADIVRRVISRTLQQAKAQSQR